MRPCSGDLAEGPLAATGTPPFRTAPAEQNGRPRIQLRPGMADIVPCRRCAAVDGEEARPERGDAGSRAQRAIAC